MVLVSDLVSGSAWVSEKESELGFQMVSASEMYSESELEIHTTHSEEGRVVTRRSLSPA